MPASLRPLARLVLLLPLAGCSLAPPHTVPDLGIPQDYREAVAPESGTVPWQPAQSTALPQAAWDIFALPELPDLLARLDKANASLAASKASYDQARSLIAQARASYFPALNGTASASKARTGNADAVTTDTLSLGLSWEADLWGRISNTVEAEQASAAASAADLAGVRLSLQAQLVQALLSLRVVEVQRRLLEATAADYERYVKLTADRVRFGVASRADLAQAESQLRSAQALSIDTGVAKAQYEHAIAVLVGELPSRFSLPDIKLDEAPLRAPIRANDADRGSTVTGSIHAGILELAPRLPVVPLTAPSTLLERRPDIAAAERRAAAANAQVGVANAAFFPVLTLSDTFGRKTTNLGDLFAAPSHFWTLGAALTGPIFDGGLRSAQKAQAVAAWQQATASYRQTVLTAFQAVEDQLAALRVLTDEARVQDEAVKAARVSAELTLAQYRAGTVGSLDVITNNSALLTAERSALELHNRRLTAAVTLIQALGGGWTAEAGATAAAAAVAE